MRGVGGAVFTVWGFLVGGVAMDEGRGGGNVRRKDVAEEGILVCDEGEGFCEFRLGVGVVVEGDGGRWGGGCCCCLLGCHGRGVEFDGAEEGAHCVSFGTREGYVVGLMGVCVCVWEEMYAVEDEMGNGRRGDGVPFYVIACTVE